MANFTPAERLVAGLLSSTPGLKKRIKRGYQFFSWILHKKKHSFQAALPLTAFGAVLDGENFFGYYDKSPVSPDGTHVVYQSTNSLTHLLPDAKIHIEVVVQRLGQNDVIARLSSAAYNWQQGARVHWLSNELLIFNDCDEVGSNYVAKVFSINDFQEVKCFSLPVQDSFKTDYFLSLNYRRLAALRADYGYRNLPVLSKKELGDIENDGIWKVDYTTGENKLLVSLQDICALSYKEQFSKAIHKVNHVMISPSGKKFIFLHRYYLGKRRFDRLVFADARTGELKLLADNGMVSHCCWAGDGVVLGYLRGPGDKNAYWLINVESGEFFHVANGALDFYGDGHPHVHGDWFVSDTYPNKSRMQQLFMCNWKTGEFKLLGEFFHSFCFSGETRCDLHPRFSTDGKKIFFDSVFDSKRRLYMMDIEL